MTERIEKVPFPIASDLRPIASNFEGIVPGFTTIVPPSTIPNWDPAFSAHDNAKQLFEARWAETRCLRRTEALSRPARRRPVDFHNPFFQNALSRRELVRLRIEEGFVWFGGEIAGRHWPAFCEEGLRSAGLHVLRRFVQLTRRKQHLLVGSDKGRVYHPDSKLLGLDAPYVTLNDVMRGGFRVDLDKTFASWDDLRASLEQLPLPCLPHAVVADECPRTGVVRNPHLWYLLPYGSEVWWAPDDPRCRKDIVRFLSGVIAGICKTLLPLGADPGGLCNPLKGKNPLSPFWTVKIWNDNVFLRLSEWALHVDTRANLSVMARESAVAVSGLRKKQSNIVFSTCQTWAFDELRRMHRSEDPDYQVGLEDRALLAANLFERLKPRAISSFERPRQALAVLDKVVEFAADRWDPARLKANDRDRGACAVEVAGLPLRERQKVGARYAASRQTAKSLEAMVNAILALQAEGLPTSKVAVAKRATLSRSTVVRHWQTAIDSAAQRAPASTISQTTTAAPTEDECVKRCIGRKEYHGSLKHGSMDRHDPTVDLDVLPGQIDMISPQGNEGTSLSSCADPLSGWNISTDTPADSMNAPHVTQARNGGPIRVGNALRPNLRSLTQGVEIREGATIPQGKPRHRLPQHSRRQFPDRPDGRGLRLREPGGPSWKPLPTGGREPEAKRPARLSPNDRSLDPLVRHLLGRFPDLQIVTVIERRTA
ncbi:hypothetical protein HPT29_027555 (plasmid) [Microvirga terrae]|uniref:Primase C-terminal 1 domain-containing protein n=1 Tax=Microvirga terrae TaxID=2740529 RepID=A0ABY5S0J4_9HYPH|nr:hypothetical protein [Microvirga terrae]UVF22778.1 hypothetical protein HPT29_027555 [Microvirga terrae]